MKLICIVFDEDVFDYDILIFTSKAKQSKFHLLTQTRYMAAIQLMWACGITACALRITSEYSFTDLGGIDSLFDCWLVVSGSDDGIRTHASRPRMIRNTAP